MLSIDWDVNRMTNFVKIVFLLPFSGRSNLKMIELHLNWKMKLENRSNNLSTKTRYENGWKWTKLLRNVSMLGMWSGGNEIFILPENRSWITIRKSYYECRIKRYLGQGCYTFAFELLALRWLYKVCLIFHLVFSITVS